LFGAIEGMRGWLLRFVWETLYKAEKPAPPFFLATRRCFALGYILRITTYEIVVEEGNNSNRKTGKDI
jgi:hypothetical protein